LSAPVKGKDVGFQTDGNITGYIKLQDGFVIRITVVIGAVKKLDMPIVAGKPKYAVMTGSMTNVLTAAEYEEIKLKGGLT